MKLSRIAIFSLLCAVVATSMGCGMINRVRARNALNEGARAYREGKFPEAEEKFRYAYELDPSQDRTPLFIARAVQQQFKPGVTTPENIAKGQEAVNAYQEILSKDPGNEDAYKAIVFLYRQMKDEAKVQELLTQRASLQSISPEKRADALTVLASNQWKCSNDITEQKENKEQVTQGNRVLFKYKKPQDQAEFEKAKKCADEGLNLVNQALSLDQSNSNAWSYKTNVLMEKAKIAEMEGDTQARDDFEKQAAEARDRAAKLNEEAQKKKEAEGAQSPAPPAS